MTILGESRKHFWLTIGMARCCGADLPAAMRDGTISHADWAAMVTRCRGCADPDECHEKMTGPTRPDAPPSYCRNAEILEKLAVG